MGILLRGSKPSTLSYDGYFKMLYSLKLFGSFKRRVGRGGGGGKVLIVKLDNVKACNEECHSVSRIYIVIIHDSPPKTNNSAIFFCHVK